MERHKEVHSPEMPSVDEVYSDAYTEALAHAEHNPAALNGHDAHGIRSEIDQMHASEELSRRIHEATADINQELAETERPTQRISARTAIFVGKFADRFTSARPFESMARQFDNAIDPLRSQRRDRHWFNSHIWADWKTPFKTARRKFKQAELENRYANKVAEIVPHAAPDEVRHIAKQETSSVRQGVFTRARRRIWMPVASKSGEMSRKVAKRLNERGLTEAQQTENPHSEQGATVTPISAAPSFEHRSAHPAPDNETEEPSSKIIDPFYSPPAEETPDTERAA